MGRKAPPSQPAPALFSVAIIGASYQPVAQGFAGVPCRQSRQPVTELILRSHLRRTDHGEGRGDRLGAPHSTSLDGRWVASASGRSPTLSPQIKNTAVTLGTVCPRLRQSVTVSNDLRPGIAYAVLDRSPIRRWGHSSPQSVQTKLPTGRLKSNPDCRRPGRTR